MKGSLPALYITTKPTTTATINSEWISLNTKPRCFARELDGTRPELFTPTSFSALLSYDYRQKGAGAGTENFTWAFVNEIYYA